uniref:Uncharacterized protein n=1 Tax=Varanus komodoensis TaxID=61221 RepID=A0A8D2IS24_VARKO
VQRALGKMGRSHPHEEGVHPVEVEKIEQDGTATPVEPEMFASAVLRPIPDAAAEEGGLKAPHRPRPLDLKQQQQQQHVAAAAPLSPSRPRSPWGRLDPYESDEVRRPGRLGSARLGQGWAVGPWTPKDGLCARRRLPLELCKIPWQACRPCPGAQFGMGLPSLKPSDC